MRISRKIWTWPVVVPLVGVLVLAGLGWREADRAQRTAELLMADYASFIAEGFLQQAVENLSHQTGLSYDPDHTHGGLVPPATRLRAYLDEDQSLPVVESKSELVRYYFSYDPGSQALKTSRLDVPPEELTQLSHALAAIPETCPASTTISFPSIGSWLPAPEWDWAALVKTDKRGKALRVAGFQILPDEMVERILKPLIDAEECACPSSMVPESLRPVRDVREVASFVLRDATGQVRHRSKPSYAAARALTKPFPPSLPLAGWTVEVRLNPEAVRPLLPYAGRGLPWPAVFVISALAFFGGLVSIRAQRRHAELLRLREDFVANVSHELKTPLARVRLFNDLLRREQPVERGVRDRYQNIIDRECRRLGMLVDNVLDFSRLEREGSTQELVPLAFRDLVEEALESFRAASNPERFSLEADVRGEALVLGDRDSFRQLVINLLDNALKHSGKGCRIRVRVSVSEQEALLSVQDDGPGIPEPERTRIFEPFYRARRQGREATSGSGLGLALVQQIVQTHRGRIWVESEIGIGSCFHVAIPVVPGLEVGPS